MWRNEENKGWLTADIVICEQVLPLSGPSHAKLVAHVCSGRRHSLLPHFLEGRVRAAAVFSSAQSFLLAAQQTEAGRNQLRVTSVFCFSSTSVNWIFSLAIFCQNKASKKQKQKKKTNIHVNVVEPRFCSFVLSLLFHVGISSYRVQSPLKLQKIRGWNGWDVEFRRGCVDPTAPTAED